MYFIFGRAFQVSSLRSTLDLQTQKHQDVSKEYSSIKKQIEIETKI